MKGNKFSVELKLFEEILRGVVNRERDFSDSPNVGLQWTLIDLGISPDRSERDAQTVSRRHGRHLVWIENVGDLIFTELHGRKRRQLGCMRHNRHDERREQDKRGEFRLHGRSPYLDLMRRMHRFAAASRRISLQE